MDNGDSERIIRYINNKLESENSNYKAFENTNKSHGATFIINSMDSNGKKVIIKAIDHSDMPESEDESDSSYALFRRESNSLKFLSGKSEYTVKLLEGPFHIEGKNISFFVMEKLIPIVAKHELSGLEYCQTVTGWIKKNGLSLVMAYMGYCISNALKEIQHAGITNQRDIKPENIFIDREDDDMFNCKFILGDFGTAHLKDSMGTNPGKKIGTRYYIPGGSEDNTDWRYDQFMLGITLYEPFNGNVIGLDYQ